MNRNLSKLLAIALVTAILLGIVPIIIPTINATTPSMPAIWVTPNQSFTTSTPIGTTFVETVYAGVASGQDAFTYQANVTYDPTMLNATSVKYTAPSGSLWWSAHTTTRVSPVIDRTHGIIVVGETLFSPDFEPGPSSGSICNITFAIIATPTAGHNFTCKIDAHQPKGSYILDPTLTPIAPLNFQAATYLYVGPPAPVLKPPVALFDYFPKPVIVGQSVTFDASASYDPDGTVVSWAWDFGDSSGGSGKIVTHTYSSVGNYVVNLTVTDNDSLTNSTAKSFLVYLFQPANLYVDPAQIKDLSMVPGSTFYVNVTLTAITSLSLCQFNLTYNPLVLNWIGAELMPVPEYPTASITVSSGFLAVGLNYVNFTLTGNPTPLVRVHFSVNGYGISLLNLTNITLLDSHGNPIPYLEEDGFFANIIRDVAVINVMPTLTWLYEGWIDDINVTVANLGNVSESFTVSAWYNGSFIGSGPVSGLAPGAETVLDIPWNATGVLEGNYTISGTASLVPYETYFNTANNLYVDGVVQVFSVIHDVAITHVVPLASWAYAGSTVPINVTAKNLGNVSESFGVTAFYNGSAISTIPVVNLASNGETVLTFSWNTSGLAEDFYTISAQASAVPFEYNLTNNYLADGLVQVLTQIRDVAIIGVTTSRTWTYRGVPVNVTVTAKNVGDVTESFTVMAFYDANLIGTVSIVNLLPNATTSKVFTWNTTGLSACHNYTISGQASIVPFEFNTTNNFLADGVVSIRLIGDINNDGQVDMTDIGIVAAAFGTSPGDLRWNPDADITGPQYLVPDGTVDMMDVALVAANFGSSC